MVRALFTCLAILAVANLAADDKKFDASKLDGKWTIVKGMKNGQESNDEIMKTDFEIAKETMTLEGPQGKFKFKFKIDDKQSPATIDLEMTESPFGAGMKAKGIVSLEGDDFKLCYTAEGDRPKKFDGKEAFLFELKRKK